MSSQDNHLNSEPTEIHPIDDDSDSEDIDLYIDDYKNELLNNNIDNNNSIESEFIIKGQRIANLDYYKENDSNEEDKIEIIDHNSNNNNVIINSLEIIGEKITNLNALSLENNDKNNDNEEDLMNAETDEKDIVDNNQYIMTDAEVANDLKNTVKLLNSDAKQEDIDEAADQYGLNDNEDSDEDDGYVEIEQGDVYPDTDKEKLESDSTQAFFDHNSYDEEIENAIFSVDVHPSLPLILSGDQRDRAFIWNMTNGEKVAELTGHTDSVVACGFSFNGALCATGSMDGTVRIWKPDGTLVHVLEGPSSEIEWIKWHSKGPIIAAGSADGTIWMWNAENALCMQVFAGHLGPVLCGTFSFDGKYLCTGSDDGTVCIWNPKNGQILHHIKGGNFSEGPVTTIAYHPNQNFLITGSQDGTACLIRTDTGKVVTKFKGHKDSVESVSFCQSMQICATGSMDNQVFIWDMSQYTIRCRLPHPDGIIKTVWNQAEFTIITACLDGILRLWDARDGKLLKSWKGHQAQILDFVVTHTNKIVSAGEDQVCLVFDL